MDRWIQNVNYLGNRYSYRRASTGLAVAAWMVWTLTVSKAIIKATAPANTKVKLWSPLGIFQSWRISQPAPPTGNRRPAPYTFSRLLNSINLAGEEFQGIRGGVKLNGTMEWNNYL